ncbi:MAG: tetratricopeptide repeat protein, partial [Deferrisomatales bacterium]
DPGPTPPGEDPPAQLARARAAADRGDLAGAGALCEAALRADPLRAEAHYLRAVVLGEGGEAAEAAQALGRAVYLDPGFALAHLALGHGARRAGDGRGAARHYRNALRALGRQADEVPVPEAGGVSAARPRVILEGLVAEGMETAP